MVAALMRALLVGALLVAGAPVASGASWSSQRKAAVLAAARAEWANVSADAAGLEQGARLLGALTAARASPADRLRLQRCPTNGGLDNPGQCAALLSLLLSTSWRQDFCCHTFDEPTSVCAWPGVTCGGDDGSAVVQLSWRGLGHKGHLPIDVFSSLPALSVLDLGTCLEIC